MDAVASLDAGTLNSLLTDRGAGENCRRFAWRGAQPFAVSEDDDQHPYTSERTGRLLDEVTAVILGKPRQAVDAEEARSWNEVRNDVECLFDHLYRLATLLPVGQDDARLLLFDDTSRIAVCPRTFIGLGPILPDDDDLNMPRYSPRSFVVDDAREEFARIRVACARQARARARVTRIVDLVGHRAAPIPAANVAYVCLWVGKDWERFTVGHSPIPFDADHEEFAELLKARIRPSAFISAEGSTLASPDFLIGRLERATGRAVTGSGWRGASTAYAIAMHGARALARAIGRDPGEVASEINRICATRDRAQALANELWASGTNQSSRITVQALEAGLPAWVIDQAAWSGVRPYGGAKP